MSSQLSCPKCSALAEQGGFSAWQWIVSICFFPIGLLSLLAGRKPTVCPKCNHSWKGISTAHVVIERNDNTTTNINGPAAMPRDVYAELAKLDDLKAKGILTQEEFDAQKKKLLT